MKPSQILRGKYTHPAFIGTSLVLLAILVLRMTRGIDLTDEMQYYGEIKGLLTTGRLFSNDLFIQQSVYILLYPVFYIYHSLFGFDGFVFFGRLVMSVLSMLVFLYAYRKLLSLNFSSVIASLTSCSLIFPITFHGIYAPSYNTISQMMWIVFALKYFAWNRRGMLFWGIFPIVMFFVHPTSAVVTSFLILARLLVEGDYPRIGKYLMISAGAAFLAVPVILYFADFHEYLSSVAFSSGYGVGSTFFSSGKQVAVLATAYGFMLVGLLLPRFISSERLSLLMMFTLAVVMLQLLIGNTGSGYAPSVARVLAFLCAIAYGMALGNASAGGGASRERIHWLMVLLLAFATTLGITSGNGVGQATGAFMVGLPILLGIAASCEANKTESGGRSCVNLACVILITLLFVAHWISFPYREDRIERTGSSIQGAPDFMLIKTSHERSELIKQVRQALDPITHGKRVLIVSEYPVFYLALDVRIETCMLYMHSVTSDTSEQELLACLSRKSPEVIVDLLSDQNLAREDSRIKRVMKKYYIERGLTCTDDTLAFNSRNKNNPAGIKLTICK